MESVRVTPSGLHAPSEVVVEGLSVLERRSDAARATVICVHGGLDRGGSFARVARRLDDFDVITYDRRGYQGSRTLTPLSLDAHAGDLVALARHEHACPVIYFGHSYGGVVAPAAAAREPALVSLVVLYETPLPWVRDRPGHHTLLDDPAAEAESFFRRVVSNSAWDRLSDEERQSRRADGPALLDDLRTLRGPWPRELVLDQVTAPVVIGYGDGPRSEHYPALVTELDRRLGHVRARQFVHAGHGAHLANPDQVARMIDEEWTLTCASR